LDDASSPRLGIITLAFLVHQSMLDLVSDGFIAGLKKAEAEADWELI